MRALFLTGTAGNQDDYAAFLRGLLPIIRRVVRMKIAESEVEDVVQEALISVHKARHTYDGGRSLMPWVLSIVNFRLNDHLRDHYKHHADRVSDETDFDIFFADVTNQGSDREYIEELLEELPDLQRRILMLLYAEGFSAREVGAQLNMSESAVKVAAHRSIQKIRKMHGI